MSLLEKYIIARWCYAIGEDFIDDVEYRTIEEQLKVEMPDNEYINRSWSNDPCPLELLEKYNMMHLYRDIKFHHASESIRSINSKEEFIEQFRYLNEPSRLSFKLDGWNIQVNYYNGKYISAETRGRSGNSLNANVVKAIVPESIPFMGKVKITGEVVIPNSKWAFYQIETGNTSQRNSVSTALANGDTGVIEFLAYNIQSDTQELGDDLYTILTSIGFQVPRHMKVENFAQLEKAISLFGRIREKYDYPSDGLVIENSQYQLALRVGAWQEEVLASYVTEYDESYGAYGVAMKVKIKPIFGKGANRSEVSVTNLQYILDCNLEIGAPIVFDIRSDSIAVLNTTKTEALQKEYTDKYEIFRNYIDNKE